MIDWGEIAEDVVREQTAMLIAPPDLNERGRIFWEHASHDTRYRMWMSFYRAARESAEERCANLGRCLREASMLATLEGRMLESFGAPIVVRVSPERQRELAERLRSMSGVGMIFDAYARCAHKFTTGAFYVLTDGSRVPVPRGVRCALEVGHAGRHSPYLRGEEEMS